MNMDAWLGTGEYARPASDSGGNNDVCGSGTICRVTANAVVMLKLVVKTVVVMTAIPGQQCW